MGKKVEKERNEIVEEFFRMNDPKNIKSMNDMYTAWKDFFAPAFQQLLDAEMEAKIGYSKNERTDNNNYRNGYYPERTVATEKWSRMVDKWDLCLSQFRIMYEGRI